MSTETGTLEREGSPRWMCGYQLLQVLGRGRCGTVYLALDVRKSRRVALKIAAPSDVDREFAALTALAHRNVVQVLGHGSCGEQSFLAMEYAAAGTLAQQPGPLGLARCFSFALHAATALAWVHKRGWVHRDVKPSNLLRRIDASLALGDFSSACRRGHASPQALVTVIGTPRYAAPEQSQGAPADPTADIYSLGACLYEFLAGRPLFPGETLLELFSQHLRAPVPALPREHAAWQPLLQAMLAKDAQRRPADGAALLATLQASASELLPQETRDTL